MASAISKYDWSKLLRSAADSHGPGVTGRTVAVGWFQITDCGQPFVAQVPTTHKRLEVQFKQALPPGGTYLLHSKHEITFKNQ